MSTTSSTYKNRSKQLTYILDIDNTIFYTFKSDYKNARPITDRINRINTLYDEGHTIIYWTARGGNSGIDWTNFTVEQLNKAGCKYTKIWMNKPSYDLWIDDKALSDSEFFK
jgi:hypothetical protein